MLIRRFRSVLGLLILTLSSVGIAEEYSLSFRDIYYYPDEFYQELQVSGSQSQMAPLLKKILQSFHLSRKGQNDSLVSSCSQETACYGHTTLKYGAARAIVMGKLYLVQELSGDYAVHDVYCNKDRGKNEFRKSPPGPNQIPDSRVINVEHTWPQSRFNRRYPKDTQKSDLHHLFPTNPQINSIRGNHLFGEVSNDLISLKCPESRFGLGSAGSEEVFEPPQQHRGNVARALFYFSIRYEIPISSDEEAILRKWHREDPVDKNEIERNEEIFHLQKNRNPFVDFPELSDRILDF